MENILRFGGLVPLPYLLYILVQALAKHRKVNFFGLLLAYLAVLIPVGVYAWGTARQSLPPLVTLGAAASAGVSFVLGLLLLIGDIRQHRVGRSYGLLSIGVAVLIAGGLVATPHVLALLPASSTSTSASSAATPPTSGFPAMNVSSTANQNTGAADTTLQNTGNTTSSAPAGLLAPAGFAFPAPVVVETTEEPAGDTSAATTETPTATHTPSRQAVLPTITPTPDYTPTPTMTLVPISAGYVQASTDGETASTPSTDASDSSTIAAGATTCSLMVLYNLNLRDEPNADATLLLTIPYSTVLTSSEVNSSNWWHVTYEGQTGWVSGDYVSPMASCELAS
ncbi:MAG: SH3 domain-containing protein [Anaerolineae bacterium]